jgi:hypothetical protein
MEHEYDQDRKHARAADTGHHDAVQPGQSSRSAQLRKPEHPIASGLVQRKGGGPASGQDAPSVHQIADGRMSGSPDVRATVPPRAKNKTGLPDGLKSGIESLSGISMDNVRVHYNSSQPAQFNALAYAQGSEIHVGPGQEQHLPHEAWHVVQQLQGRVQPTIQMKSGVPVNDDERLEAEADVMGVKALGVGGQVDNVAVTQLIRTQPDLRLAAHEAAHVVQQRRGTGARPAGFGCDANEHHTDAIAELVVRGASAEVALDRASTGGGSGAQVVQRKSAITSSSKVAEWHALSQLHENFKAQNPSQQYSVKADGNATDLASFYGGKAKIDKPTQVKATIEGTRRMAGGRATNSVMQSAMGNLGDHERAVFGRDPRKSYEGGHLISDKILGDDSYVEANFVPMHTDLNSPDFRNIERKAEVGLVDSLGTPQHSAPIEMTVNVTYADDPYTVTLADLINRGVIPSTFTTTDSGGTSITFPRRVPAQIKAGLAFDTAKYPTLRFPEQSVGAVSDGRLGGVIPTTRPLPLRQPSQENIWYMDSVHQSSGVNRTGGGSSESFVAFQPVPQDVSQQPRYTGGGLPPVARTIPIATITSVFKNTVSLSELTKGDYKDTSAYNDILTTPPYGESRTFARELSKAVRRRHQLCQSNGKVLSLQEIALEQTKLAKVAKVHANLLDRLLKDPSVRV